jgi:hypothetical protein
VLPMLVDGPIAGAGPAADAGPDAPVLRLYAEHQPWKKKDVLFNAGYERLFDASLAKLWKADNDCMARTRGVGLVDFDPVIDAQDYDDDGLHDLRITVGRKDAKAASVDVTFLLKRLAPSTKRHLVYRVVNTPEGWRIHDIEFGRKRDTLRQLLSQPCE